MSVIAVEDVGDRFSSSRSERRNIHQAPHSFVIRRGNYRAGVSMSGHNDGTLRSGKSAPERCRVIA
jgi:hypothetical protein